MRPATPESPATRKLLSPKVNLTKKPSMKHYFSSNSNNRRRLTNSHHTVLQRRQRVQSSPKGPTDDEEVAAALLLYCHNTMQHQTQAAGQHNITPTKSVSLDATSASSSQPASGLSGLALLAGAANQPSNQRNSMESFYTYTALSTNHQQPVAAPNPATRKVHIGLPYQDLLTSTSAIRKESRKTT